MSIDTILNSVTEQPAVVQMVRSLLDDFTCAVCREPMIYPYTGTCGHSLCYECMREWLKEQCSCPICRKRLSAEPVLNIVMRKTLVNALSSISSVDKAAGAQIDEFLAQCAAKYDELKQKTQRMMLRGAGSAGAGAFDPNNPDDGVERCEDCHWELIDGTCPQCGGNVIRGPNFTIRNGRVRFDGLAGVAGAARYRNRARTGNTSHEHWNDDDYDNAGNDDDDDDDDDEYGEGSWHVPYAVFRRYQELLAESDNVEYASGESNFRGIYIAEESDEDEDEDHDEDQDQEVEQQQQQQQHDTRESTEPGSDNESSSDNESEARESSREAPFERARVVRNMTEVIARMHEFSENEIIEVEDDTSSIDSGLLWYFANEAEEERLNARLFSAEYGDPPGESSDEYSGNRGRSDLYLRSGTLHRFRSRSSHVSYEEYTDTRGSEDSEACSYDSRNSNF